MVADGRAGVEAFRQSIWERKEQRELEHAETERLRREDEERAEAERLRWEEVIRIAEEEVRETASRIQTKGTAS